MSLRDDLLASCPTGQHRFALSRAACPYCFDAAKTRAVQERNAKDAAAAAIVDLSAKLAEAAAARDAALRREEAAEAREKALREELWAMRYGDGCVCEGGPFDPNYPHTHRCRKWQAALTDEQRAALAAGKETPRP